MRPFIITVDFWKEIGWGGHFSIDLLGDFGGRLIFFRGLSETKNIYSWTQLRGHFEAKEEEELSSFLGVYFVKLQVYVAF